MTHDVYVTKIQNIRPHPDNARLGSVDVLVESLRVHGQYKPIVIASDGVIVAGNHTYFAAMELGWESMQVVQLPFKSDDPRATKIMLVDNRSTDRSSYEAVDLARLLESLDDDLLGTGYDNSSVDDLLALLQEQESQPLTLSDDNTERLPSLEEKMQKYKEMGRRMIVLDYSQEEYPIITRQLKHLREKYDVPSNAVAVQTLLKDTITLV